MTKREAAIISAYTGFLCGKFSELHAYVEEKFGRPVWTHELGNKEIVAKLKELSKEDFCSFEITEN